VPADRSTHTDEIVVLKFGGSVLVDTDAIATAVHECYRWVRRGTKVVAVVSALGDTTDRLLTDARRYGHAPSAAATATLVATGEATSAAHLWLGLDAAGLRAIALDPRDVGLRVEGHLLDARPVAVDPTRIRAAFAPAGGGHAVVVVPGFVGVDAAGRVSLLGRGGSDLSALVIADALGARCRLVKDVPGLFERDPARPGPFARRFATVTFDDAARLDGAILQRKALEFARSRSLAFEVAALSDPLDERVTIVGAPETTFAVDRTRRRLRTAILGFGVVGRGVWQHLAREHDRFEIVGVAVRTPKRHGDALPPSLLRRGPVDLAHDPSIDLVVECLGGTDVALAAIEAALGRGAQVVTANKAVFARCAGAIDRAIAIGSLDGRTPRLRASAAVGGAAPCLETIERWANDRVAGGIASFEGILNGTTNVILGRMARGATFDEALAEAQALGFAEGDPSADLDGHDACDKATLLARAAFGRVPARVEVEGIRAFCGGPACDGLACADLRLVARATPDAITVRCERVEPGTPLDGVHDEWNRLVVRTRSGRVAIVEGKGAGRRPTAEAVVADAFDAWRDAAREHRVAPEHVADLVGGAA
jgi:homoserine dehydrogenase